MIMKYICCLVLLRSLLWLALCQVAEVLMRAADLTGHAQGVMSVVSELALKYNWLSLYFVYLVGRGTGKSRVCNNYLYTWCCNSTYASEKISYCKYTSLSLFTTINSWFISWQASTHDGIQLLPDSAMVC